MRLYLAGPMGGFPERNQAAFVEAAAALRAAGFEVTSPAELHGPDWPPAVPSVEPDDAFREYLRTDLAAMLADGCRGMAMLDGWHRSRGARIEFNLARDLGMPVDPADAWLQAAQLAAGRGISTWSIRDARAFLACASSPSPAGAT